MADPDKLRQFMMKMVGDIGAAVSVPLVRTGIRLGLYKAMDGAGPITSAALAEKAGISERYAREWLAQNAASGYLTYDPSGKTFELPPEQAMALAREDSYVYIGGTIEAVCAIYPNAAEGRTGVPVWRRHRMGRARGLPVLRGRRHAAAALRGEHSAEVAAGARWRERQARGRRRSR